MSYSAAVAVTVAVAVAMIVNGAGNDGSDSAQLFRLELIVSSAVALSVVRALAVVTNSREGLTGFVTPCLERAQHVLEPR